MTRRYEEQVEVRFDGMGRPLTFQWRGKLHVVRTVVDQWVQRSDWWEAAPQGRSEVDRLTDDPASTGDELEQRVWRVEASRGRLQAMGVYDLCGQGRAGGWQGMTWHVLRVMD